MAKGNGLIDSPMTDAPKAPSPFSAPSGSFGGHTAKEFKAPPSSYGVITPTQYYDGLNSGSRPKGDTIEGSPMDQQITPRKPKGS